MLEKHSYILFYGVQITNLKCRTASRFPILIPTVIGPLLESLDYYSISVLVSRRLLGRDTKVGLTAKKWIFRFQRADQQQ